MTNRQLVRTRVNDCVQQDRCEQEPNDVATDSQRYVLVWTLQLSRTVMQDVLDEKDGDRVDSDSHTDCPRRTEKSTLPPKTKHVVQHTCQGGKP